MRNQGKENNRQGLFIVFEGIDGCGKSTQSRRLAEFFQKSGTQVLLTNEPSKSVTGQKIRELISGKNVPQQQLAEMFIKDRRVHLENEVLPALREGMNVICDRYFYSNIAYQGASGLPINFLKQQNSPFRKPDCIFFFDLPVTTALERIDKRNEAKSIFEKKVFLENVREIFHQLQQEEKKSYLINAGQSEDEIFLQITRHLPKG